MNILSIDTSGQLLSIALLKNDSLTEESYSSDKKHSENILPLLKKLMDKSDIDFSAYIYYWTGYLLFCGYDSLN